ncbi:MAG: RES family NAD+ phosphorylase [Gammaproteobacteria bacterium]|nr:RES family NAD+ phosphorylase [Gammaproteobacteria bacterium]
MKLYRICPEFHLENYSGMGASYQDGARWNKAGTPVLYFALSPAVALLEMGNYLPSPRLVPKSYRLGIYELPEAVVYDTLSNGQLPEDWSLYPFPASTQTLGTEWLRKRQNPVLLVPSAAVPAGLERIAILNPLHPDCKKLRLEKITADLYNKRAFRGL